MWDCAGFDAWIYIDHCMIMSVVWVVFIYIMWITFYAEVVA